MTEFELINFIKEYFNSNYIGDDAFFHKNLLISKDILIENIHFILTNNYYEIGAKAIISNVSDILAMGGKPGFFFLGLGIPPKIKENQLKDFFKGLKEFSLKYNVALGGGDLSKSEKDFFISITIIGEAIKSPVLRSNAKIDDSVFVAGEIGDSEIGLRILKKEFSCDNRDYFIKRHYIKELYPEFVYELIKNNIINSMIDVSDGFLQDIEHILELSNVGAEIYAKEIPVSEELKKLKPFFSEKEYYEIILTSGEEYSLIFTSDKKYDKKIFEAGKKYNVPLKKVGKIIEEKRIIIKDFKEEFSKKGYSHF